MKNKFWKTFCVDLILLVILFWLFVFSKNYVAGFLEDVNSINVNVDEMTTELDNQTTAQVESFVDNYQYSIWWMFIFMIYIVPFIVYLSIAGSQSLNIAFLKNNYKRILVNLLYGLPLLAVFYWFMNYFINNFYSIFSSISVLIIFLLLIVLMFVLSYIWFGIVCGDYQKFLRKFYLFLPLYVAFILLFVLSFIITGYMAALYLVNGLLILEFFRYLLFVCVLLVGIQFLRKFMVKKVNS